MKPKIALFLYNRLFDPVIQSNFWLYIDGLLKEDNSEYDFFLISYEDKKFPLTLQQLEKIEQWQSQGLSWTRLKWHAGLSPIEKLKDFLAGFWTMLKLRIKGVSNVISVGSIAGGFVYLYSFFTPLKRYVYCYEPHSEYAVDNGIWDKKSLQFRVLNFLEKKCVKNTAVVSSGTVFMEDRIRREWNYSKPTFFKIPTVVNDNKFILNINDRIQIRKELNISKDTKLLFYPGKFGDLYYKGEIPIMYKSLRKEIDNLHLLIISPNDPKFIHDLFDASNLSRDTYTLIQTSYDDIHRYFSAADFGIVAVPPGSSKKFVSNIKVGEYLCSGLPYLITEGVSEDFLYATKKSVGVVVKDFTVSEIKKAAPKISTFLNQSVNERNTHCREVGVAYRGYSILLYKFRSAIEELLK